MGRCKVATLAMIWFFFYSCTTTPHHLYAPSQQKVHVVVQCVCLLCPVLLWLRCTLCSYCPIKFVDISTLHVFLYLFIYLFVVVEAFAELCFSDCLPLYDGTRRPDSADTAVICCVRVGHRVHVRL